MKAISHFQTQWFIQIPPAGTAEDGAIVCSWLTPRPLRWHIIDSSDTGVLKTCQIKKILQDLYAYRWDQHAFESRVPLDCSTIIMVTKTTWQVPYHHSRPFPDQEPDLEHLWFEATELWQRLAFKIIKRNQPWTEVAGVVVVSPGLLMAASSSAVLGRPRARPLARPVGWAVLSPSPIAGLSLKHTY